MHLWFLLIWLFSFSATPAHCQAPSFHCILVGEVVDRPTSNALLLTKEGGDPRVSSVRIPIKNNRFYYELEADQSESYVLIFADEFEKSAWKPIVFFAEADTVRFLLHPEDRFMENVLRGGELNQQLAAFDQTMEDTFGLHSLGQSQGQLIAENRYFTDEATAIQMAIRKAGTDEVRDSLQRVAEAMNRQQEHLTPDALEVTNLFRERFMDWMDWKATQVITTPSLITYRELVALVRMSKAPSSDPVPIALPDLLASYERHYRPLYPDHPYTVYMETHLASLNRIRVGGEYIDFTAPDFDGHAVTLSEHIKGKITLINLWASWCGPCRRKGIELIPVYEAYKNKGFEVVGVARERNKAAGIRAAQQDQYPWLNLLEVNDSQSIWNKYGLGNSGGGMFLVDETGVILAIAPSAATVRAILAQRLE